MVVALFWTLFAFASAFAFVEALAGARWGVAGAMLYVGGYWSLYFLLHSVARQVHCAARSEPIRLTTQSICCASTRMRPWYSALNTASASPLRPRAASNRVVSQKINGAGGRQCRKSLRADSVGLAFVDQGRGTVFQAIGDCGRLTVIERFRRRP